MYLQKNIQYSFVSCILLISLMLPSCIKEEASLQDPQVGLNPGLGLPVAHAHYTLAAVFESTDTIDFLQPNEDGILTVRYSEQLFSQIASEIITFNQEISSSISINVSELLEKNTQILYDTIEFGFENSESPAGQGLLYQLKFNYAEFWLSDNYDGLIGDLSVKVKFPNIVDEVTLDTAFLERNIGQQDTSKLPMSGKTATFINIPEEGRTQLPVQLELEGLIKNIEDDFKISYSFELINYDFIRGYFGEFDMELGTTNIPLDLYSLVDSVELVFKEPQFNINFQNSFGIALDLFMKNLYAVSNSDEVINIDFLPNAAEPFSLRPPPQNVIQDSLFEVPVNEVLGLLARKPKRIFFNPVGQLNPGGLSDTNYINFDSQFALDVGVEIPLEFWGVVGFTDRLAFDGSNLDNITELQYLALILTSNNRLPLEAAIDVIFTSGNEVMYQVGGEDGFHLSSNITGQDQFFEETLDIDNSQFENLRQSDSLSLKIFLKTAGADEAINGDTNYIPFNASFEDYFIDVTVKIIAEGEVVLPPK